MPLNVLPLHLKQTFPFIIWIFTEGEGDGIKSRLPFKIFSILPALFQSPVRERVYQEMYQQTNKQTNKQTYLLCSNHQ